MLARLAAVAVVSATTRFVAAPLLLQRSFAAASTAVRKPPPSVFGSTGKLATKLFQESSKSKNLSEVREDLRKFRRVFENSVALRSLFLNPIVSEEKRSEALTKVFKAAGISTKEAQAFIRGAAATKNLGRLKQIVQDFDKLVTYELKEVPAVVTSAEPLQPAQVKRLETALKSKVAPGESVVLQTKVDPSILGGIIVSLDQSLLDLSVARQIRKIDAALRA